MKLWQLMVSTILLAGIGFSFLISGPLAAIAEQTFNISSNAALSSAEPIIPSRPVLAKSDTGTSAEGQPASTVNTQNTTNESAASRKAATTSQPASLSTQTVGPSEPTVTYVNVKDKGAVGDGVHDDTGAVNAAINSFGTSGGTVYFPAGTYLISGSYGIILNKSNLTFRGEDANQTLIKPGNPSMASIFTTSGSYPNLSNFSFSHLGFTYDDNSISGRHTTILLSNGVKSVSVENCRFWNMPSSVILANQISDLTVKNSVFDSPGNAQGTALQVNGPADNINVSDNTIRYLYQGIVIASNINGENKPITNVVIERNDLDFGWWLIKPMISREGNGITYTANSLADTAENFPELSGPTTSDWTHNVRIMPLRQSGNGTFTGTTLTDPNAKFVTSGVLRGELVRTSKGFGIVSKIKSETELEVERWQSLTSYGAISAPANGTEYKVFGIYHGLIKANTANSLTLHTSGTGGWMDLTGSAVTPPPGTRYEILVGHPVYPIHVADGTSNVTIKNNTLKKGWADQISTYGTVNAKITGNQIEDGEDTGITMKGSKNAYVARNTIFHQGGQGIYAYTENTLFENNNISDTQWTAVGSTIVANFVLNSGINNIVRNNTITRTSYSQGRYGIIVYSRGRDAVNNKIMNNLVRGHLIADIFITRVTGGLPNSYYVRNTLLYNNNGTLVRNQDMNTILAQIGLPLPIDLLQ